MSGGEQKKRFKAKNAVYRELARFRVFIDSLLFAAGKNPILLTFSFSRVVEITRSFKAASGITGCVVNKAIIIHVLQAFFL